ncbi:sensor histidine kinase [Mesoterricola sediminis]|uniref:Signal transduction histidine-protein kinase/phosphatase MprB n=1 Tax=Mesoterricola sediminis TaxID=2927980 RepID=A0AA48H0Z3_9BACT|nr:ATP-binding protein [Mesoterricola sediminis]BDU78015.1 PAS domain-containing sensor histidine kinase [Mesoterricola sediminis]
MAPKPKRHPELTRLYAAVGLSVLIWAIFMGYRVLSRQVEMGLDAPSKWSLMALGLTNVLAIGTLLFIVIRSIAKLYFERRSGILGARIRTRLVLAFLAVGIAPTMLLFALGRNFIRKNVDRWFMPETMEVIQDGRHVNEAFREQVRLRLKAAAARLDPARVADLEAEREALGFDLLARLRQGAPAGAALAPGRQTPALQGLGEGSHVVHGTGGEWQLGVGPVRGEGDRIVAGIFVTRETLEGMTRLDKRYRESFQIHAGRESLESLPQSTLLFLTVLTLFVAVWTGLAIARTISEPVRGLARAAQRVGMGDLEVSLPEQGEDELAFLSRTFNAMTRDLRQSRSAIEAQAERIEGHRAYLDQLVEALPVGLLSWQADLELRTFNSVARGWLGVTGESSLDRTWAAFSRLPSLGRLPELVAEVRGANRAHVEEIRIGGGGDGRPVRAIIIPLTGGGVLAVLEDLSLLAHAEKRAAWQEVARRMAHEVKNPLTPIKLTAQRLQRRSRDGRLDPDTVSDAAATILAEVASLTRLVDSFTQFAKLPAPHPADLDATELVRHALRLYEPTHPGVAFDLDLPDHLPVHWDGDMVKRALINMVDNAISAMEGQGRIRVSLRAEAGVARLDIEDDGPGVPEENRHHLFEPYFSTKQRGTGLGLAIVRRIAEDHHGEARYAPLAPGSRFTLRLPLRG